IRMKKDGSIVISGKNITILASTAVVRAARWGPGSRCECGAWFGGAEWSGGP
ncbi:hypothetical protein ACLBVR_36745, partial [Pseudomonas aeruginosa]|uniref:hypothetical protein n=1 Tax=Pseudomonas aeruginosa TaxID=287 RepID=UPI003968F8AD